MTWIVEARDVDVISAVARIEQLNDLIDRGDFGDAMGGLALHLLDRLVTCDVPRLRALVSEDALTMLDHFRAERS